MLVTGAARGIGAALARVLARDGAQVVALDVPSAGDALAAVANEIGGTAVQLDLTGRTPRTRLADHLADRHGRVDVVVHNAGITRDKTLGRMDADRWDPVIDVNLSSQERINDVLLERELIPAGGRMVARLLDRRDRRQPGPDQLRDQQGRGDRPGRLARPGAGRAGDQRQRGRPRLHRDPADRPRSRW